MPCANGTRDRIEAGKRYYREQKAFLRSPEWAVWTSLASRVHDTEEGFSRLTSDEKLYYATNSMSGDVYNGGFHQYFFNHASSYYSYAIEGLRRTGAAHALELLQRAKALLFPDVDVPTDVSVRREALAHLGDASVSDELDRLDRFYYEDRDDIGARLEELLRPLLASRSTS